MNRIGFSAGSSLIELMISTMFVTVLMAISYTFARAVFLSVQAQDAKSDAQGLLMTATDMLARDLRLAGFSASGQPLEAVRAATRERVEVAADLDGDGVTDDPNELIAYSYSAEKHELVRATGGASPQPLVPNVPSGGLRFAFFDANGSEITGDGALATEQRRRIHRIDVVLQTELSNADTAGRKPPVSAVSTSICLRNQ
jgi:hypothetical protein